MQCGIKIPDAKITIISKIFLIIAQFECFYAKMAL
jgi:hypothetical protein